MAVKILRLGWTGKGTGMWMSPKWSRAVCDRAVFVPGAGGVGRHAYNTG